MDGRGVFPMAIERRWRLPLFLWGVTTGRAVVLLNGEDLEARFGFSTLRTRLNNVERWTITGPYRWWRAIGLRSNWPFRDYAFDSNSRQGIDLYFRERVRFGRILRAAKLTVTVADPEAFAAVLTDRGIPGEDLRRR